MVVIAIISFLHVGLVVAVLAQKFSYNYIHRSWHEQAFRRF